MRFSIHPRLVNSVRKAGKKPMMMKIFPALMASMALFLRAFIFARREYTWAGDSAFSVLSTIVLLEFCML